MIGHRAATVHLLRRLALAAHAAGDPAAAQAHLDESLALCRELDDEVGSAECLEGLALTLVPTNPTRATHLLSAAVAARGPCRPSPHAQPLPFSHTRPPLERIPTEPTAAAARSALGHTAFATAYASGRHSPLDRARGPSFDPLPRA